MKLSVSLLSFYVFTLLSVTSIKVLVQTFHQTCEKHCIKTNSENECSISKFLMGIQFSPLQILVTFNWFDYAVFHEFGQKIKQFFHVHNLKNQFVDVIWHPPKL